MFKCSVIIIKELLKALATFVGSFNFSSLTSMVRGGGGNCSTECTFRLSFLKVFHFVIRFCYQTTVVSHLSFFQNLGFYTI